MNKNVAAVSFILVVATVSGCISDQERAARRACALDVKGDYSEVRPDGVSAGKLTVDDESSINDVKLTFTRGALYDGEQPFIDRIASQSDKTAVSTSLVLGAGDDGVVDALTGGQSISEDFGETDQVAVGAPSVVANADVTGATDPTVQYALSLSIANGSDQLKGTMTVTFSENDPEATSDKTQVHTESKSFDVVFKRTAGVLSQGQSDACKAAVDGK